MFKDLKFLKFGLILLFAVIIMSQQFNKYKSTEFIFNIFSYAANQKIDFNFISNTQEAKANFQIKNIIHDKVIFDSTLSISKTYDYFDSTRFLTDGYPKSAVQINELFNAGIYSTGRKNSFVVSSQKKSEVTIVYPALNNLCYTSQQGKRIFEADTTFISTNLPSKTDEWTLGMRTFFKTLESKYSVNYITDLDIENESFLNKTKLLVLYGRLTFWTPKMIENIERFINSGGRLFIASSDVLYGKCCVDRAQKRIKLRDCSSIKIDEKANAIQSWNQISSDTSYASAMRYAFHSNYGGKNSSQKGMEILIPSNPIFKEIDLMDLSKDLDIGTNYIGTLNISPTHFAYNSLNLNRVSLLAKTLCKKGSNLNNTGGVIAFKPENGGGKAIVIGTSDLCLKESQHKKSIKKLFLNTIDYLLSD